MLPTDRELMQQALEALEYPGPSWPEARQSIAAALRERLAQPEQEPVAVLVESEPYSIDEIDWESLREQGHTVQPLYTVPQPRQWQGLADEEIKQIELSLRQYNSRDTYDLSLKDFARAIESKLREKNGGGV